jgi:hypothetical protein
VCPADYIVNLENKEKNNFDNFDEDSFPTESFCFPVRTLGWCYTDNFDVDCIELIGGLKLLYWLDCFDLYIAWDNSHHLCWSDYDHLEKAHILNRPLKTFGITTCGHNRGERIYYRAVGYSKCLECWFQALFENSVVVGKPIVRTDNATCIDENSAVLNGFLTHMGGANYCNIRFEWNKAGVNGSNTHEYPYVKILPKLYDRELFSFQLNNLVSGTKYYYRAVAENDVSKYIASSESFTTTGENPGNKPPYKAKNPVPSDNAEDIDINIDLNWKGGDPDGDKVTYSLYFGTDMSPDLDELIVENLNDTSYSISKLDSYTVYYWQVESKDPYDKKSLSDVWRFKTKENYAPEIPILSGENKGFVNKKCSFSLKSVDPENDNIYYLIDWGDGTITDWLGPYDSGVYIDNFHSWDEPGRYYVKVKSRDVFESESEWSDTLVIFVYPNIDVDFSGGFAIKSFITNQDTNNYYDLNFEIQLTQDIILDPTKNTDVSMLPAGNTILIRSNPLFGFCKSRIMVKIELPYYELDEELEYESDCIIMGSLVKMI